MITTRLKRQCSARSLLVEIAEGPLPGAIDQFYRACREQGVQISRQGSRNNQIAFYVVESVSSPQVRGITLENTPSSLQFMMAVVYITSEEDEKEAQARSVTRRTLLLRQGMDIKFFEEYQFENTQSQLESVVYLCELATTIINCNQEQEVSFYDQRTEEIKGGTEGQREKLWRNTLFQIPGLGREKCLAIAQQFPTYESLLQDYLSSQQLKEVQVSKGTREVRLGKVLAERVYRCLFTEQGSVRLYEEE